MECLDEETVLAFASGDLPDIVRRRAQEHIASCDECRALVSAVARSSMIDAKKPNLEVSATELADSGNAGGDGSSPVRRGDVLAGKYVVDTVLGAGGMGVVVSAHQRDLDRRVAVKFLLPAACEVQGAVERFLREGKAAARITSEHVARVIDTGKLDTGAPYLVMEHLVGADLSAVAKEKGRVPWSDVVEYVLQACEAIVEAHSLSIVHRDLKPANLFLTKRADGTPLVKVLDFGISKIDGGSRKDLTTASMLMGSPRYMSPEQMLSAKDVDARTDIWALGVIIYELIAGKPVWDADTVHGLSALIQTAPTPFLRKSAPDAPEALEVAFHRCLTKARDQRMPSVADLALALEPIASPRAKGSVERILKVAGRGRPSIAPVSSHPHPSAPPNIHPPSHAPVPVQAALAPPPEKSRSVVPLIAGAVGALLVLGIVLNVMAAKKTTTDPTPVALSAVINAPTVPSTSSEPLPSSEPTEVASVTPLTKPSTQPAAKTVVVVKKTTPQAQATTVATTTTPPAPQTTTAGTAPNRALVDRK